MARHGVARQGKAREKGARGKLRAPFHLAYRLQVFPWMDSWQDSQIARRFEGVSKPPADRGTTWWAWIDFPLPQRWHRPPSRAMMYFLSFL